ncbi:MAG: small subunit ribosomal protein [Actinomycetota bacterium]|nr:small subunit ribosomal protein [Actinomycetota bacterium]
MAVKIRLKRMGKIHAPYYRIVVADSRTKRDGRAIEEIGKYHPTEEPSYIEVSSERVQYWLGVGAQPTEQVLAILKITGDWQKYRGEPGSEGTLRVAAPRADKRAVFEEAAKETMNEPKSPATTPRGGRKKGAKSAEGKAAKPAEAKPAEKAAEAKDTETAAEAKPAEKAAEAKPAETAVEAKPAETAAEAKAEGAEKAAAEGAGA